MNLKEKIRRALTEEAPRKNITISLDANLLEQAERIAKSFSEVKGKMVSRNTLIEDSLREYLEAASSVLAELGYEFDDESDADLENDAEISIDDYDTVIFPAHNEGFHETFLGEDAWYSVRIREDRIPKIKYVAIYRASPISGITHYAKVKSIQQYKDTKKKIIYFDGSAIALPEIVILGDTNQNAMRAPRYTTIEKLIAAKAVADLF
ncbi:MAG: ribbon-helix-helix domain-containing protein [Selenomonadaceae bacterium]